MIGFFIFKNKVRGVLFKNAFHIKGVMILGRGIVVRHHKIAKIRSGTASSAYSATYPTGNSGPISN